MKAIMNKMMPLMSCMAFVAFVSASSQLGTMCRTWLYQPPVPAKLRDKM